MEFARALAAEEEIEVELDGGRKTLKKSGMTMEVIAGFEQFLKDRAFDELELRRPRMLPAEYERRYQDLLKECAAGAYGFLGDCAQRVYQSAMTDPMNPGAIELLYLRLVHANPGERITREIAKRWLEQNTEKAIRAFMQEATPDPNSHCPPDGSAGADHEPKPSSPDSCANHSTSASTASAS